MAKDPENWAELHREEARQLFRLQLADVLGVHLPLMYNEGHLTKDDIIRELVGGIFAVTVTAMDVDKAVASG